MSDNPSIPAAFHDLVDNSNSGAFMVLSVILKDGSPITSPIWFLAGKEGTFYVASAPDSLKARCMLARPRVAATIMSRENYARYISLRGDVVTTEFTERSDLYAQLVRKYEGRDPVRMDPMQVFQIRPFKISAFDYTHEDY